LIVHDEDTIHSALRRPFRREPYELLHAFDAAEAWALLEAHPDVAMVLCDHYMPGTHGLDLLKEVRVTHPEIKTLILTAQADLQLVIAAINEGRIHRSLTKPWDPEELRREVRSLFGGDGPDLARLQETAEIERRLREQMLPPRDEETGAFIIEADALGGGDAL
ncbi:MAG: response regulator, partial [Planctomycetota bacterium]